MSHAFRFGKYRAHWGFEPHNICMKTNLIDELLAIPADATTATVQGVEMQIISADQADKMLDADEKDERTHECILKNGRFLFESENGELKALYKAQD